METLETIQRRQITTWDQSYSKLNFTSEYLHAYVPSEYIYLAWDLVSKRHKVCFRKGLTDWKKSIFLQCSDRYFFPLKAVRLGIFLMCVHLPCFLNPFILLASTASRSSEFHNLTQREKVLVSNFLAGNFITYSSCVLSEVIVPHTLLLCDFIDLCYTSLSSLLSQTESVGKS